MTDQNSSEKSLEALKKDVSKAKSNRKVARDSLRNAVDAHRGETNISERLREKKARFEGEQAKLRSVKNVLDNRISEAKSRTAGTAEEQEKQQAEVRELEKNREGVETQLDGYVSKLEDLAKEIEEAVKRVEEAEEQLISARKDLRNKQKEVLLAASEVIKKAASQPLKEKIEGIGNRIFDKLGMSGTLSVGYIFTVIIGLVGDVIYYGDNGVNIFHYAQPEDFFLSGYKFLIIPLAGFVAIWLVLTAIKRVFEGLAKFGFPVFTEMMASILPWIIKWLTTPIALLLMISITAHAFAFTQQWQQSTSDQVCVVLEDSFEYANKLAWIGSNSRYAFFCSDLTQCMNDKTDKKIMIIPLDRIASINESKTDTVNNCRNPEASMEVEFKQNVEIKGLFERLIKTLESNNRIPPVTESEVRLYVENTMECGKGQPYISDFILFENDKSDLRKQALYKIIYFLKENKDPLKAVVYGFASPDGDRGGNKQLAGERACKVANQVCEINNLVNKKVESQAKTNDKCGCPEVDIISDQGEDHFINGVANSRSALIAACG